MFWKPAQVWNMWRFTCSTWYKLANPLVCLVFHLHYLSSTWWVDSGLQSTACISLLWHYYTKLHCTTLFIFSLFLLSTFQDVSFGPVLAASSPLRSTDLILLLDVPLASGKSHPRLSLPAASCEDQHLLFTLLVTWLVSLAVDMPLAEQGIFAPFHVTGLMQSVFEGQICLLVAVSLLDQGNVLPKFYTRLVVHVH